MFKTTFPYDLDLGKSLSAFHQEILLNKTVIWELDLFVVGETPKSHIVYKKSKGNQ
jgi:hypothetical protein